MMDSPKRARWFLRLLSCIRFDEVLVLQGAPLLGAVFAMGHFTHQSAALLLLLAAGNAFLVAHVFMLNDWSGVHQDLRDPTRSAGVFLNRGIRRNEIGALLLILLLLSLMAFNQLGRTTLVIGLMIAVASALYSVPHVYMKGIPLANSLLHVVSGLLHFLLGYSVFKNPDMNGLQIGLFFATIFSAGHLTQEVRDCDADFRNGIQTNAVKFGKKQSFIASFVLFTLADALLIALAMKGTVPQLLALLVAAIYPVHLYWMLQALHEGLTFEAVRRLQARYRVLYAGIGIGMVVFVILA
ncbi:UbiA family prenyltransferase [Acidovorax sp. Root275]|uniref:UbiA family prenyltransferase n=1 Tax=Acidovorax sp. Root275 TaxID=1736508 RepID=UPI0009E7D68A|nr:UbiA family prenyltransferase [Acidovorax sp. Root275]